MESGDPGGQRTETKAPINGIGDMPGAEGTCWSEKVSSKSEVWKLPQYFLGSKVSGRGWYLSKEGSGELSGEMDH